MRGLLMVGLAAAGLAIAVPEVASAADGCGRGRFFNGVRCVWVAPRVYAPGVYAPRVYAPVRVYRGARYYGYRGGYRGRYYRGRWR